MCNCVSYSCVMSNPRGESTGGGQSVDRAVSVLEILAHRGEAGVSEVAADIGVHKSTAFRLLGALEDRELVEVEELEDGLNAIAAPIRDHTGEVLAALSVSGPV